MTRPLSKHIAAIVTAGGGPHAFSVRHDISEGHIKAVCEGRVVPGARTMKACGLRVDEKGEVVRVGR